MLKEEKEQSVQEETIGKKMDKIWNSVTGIGKKISDAIEDDMVDEGVLVSVKNSVLDFNLIEQDVKRIHERFEKDGSRVLGSYLVLNDKQNTMEIQTYKQSGEKTFVSTTEAKVTRVRNLPPDVLTEFKEKGVVKLHLKLEQSS